MRELGEWAREAAPRLADRPWIMFGKGPSFAQRSDHDLDEHVVLTLNHAVREVHADVAHVIDIDVVHDCEDVIADRCDVLVMPRYPHIGSRPGLVALEDYVSASPALTRLDDEGRLVWYNIATAPVHHDDSPVLPAKYFGSEAALAVIGEVGASIVRSLGVDGGTGYATSFDASVTHLSNGQPSFDMQFAELRSIADRYDLDFQPLHQPLRVFVGATLDEMVPYRVLAHSIHRRSSVPVIVEPLTTVRSPMPQDRQNRPRTQFSFARFHIPELCSFGGRAIYLDSDMLVFGDIAELALRDLGDRWLACTTQEAPEAWRDSPWFKPGRQFSVMLLDCGALPWDITEIVERLDRGELSYGDLMFDLAVVPHDRIDDGVDPAWNSLEHIDASTRLVHYTVVPTQPWKVTDNPNGDAWLEAFRQAVGDGAVPRQEVEALVRSGGRHDLLDVFDAVAPAVRRRYRDTTEVALHAALDEIDRLRARTVAGRARRIGVEAIPAVQRVSARSRFLTAGVRRLAAPVKRVLRL